MIDTITRFPAPMAHVVKVIGDKMSANMQEWEMKQQNAIMKEALEYIASGEDIAAAHLVWVARKSLTEAEEI